jgi:hypothetical protein
MIKPAALLMGAVMVATSTGTYYGLELLPPGLIPPPIGRAAPDAPAQAAARPDPAQAVVAAAAAPAPVAAPAEPEVTEQDLAEEPAPVAPPPAAAPTPDPAPAEKADAAVAEAEPAAPASAPPVPAQQQQAQEADARAGEPAKTETASAAPATAAAAEADAIKPWWPDPAKVPANQLKLQYAGQVQGQGAIALLFSAPPKVDTLAQHATVKSASGETVAASWTLGKNPKLAVLGGLAPGRYTVILNPQVADEQGYMLGATLTGPVYVKP